MPKGLICVKLSFSTLGCPNWPWQTVLDRAAEYGYSGLEIRGVNGVMAADEIGALAPENRKSLAGELESRGLSIVCLGTSCSFHDPEKFDAAVDEGKKAIDVAAGIGAPFIRVFGDQIASPELRDEVIDRVSRGVNTLCDYAKGSSVRVLQEVHGDFNRLETLLPVAKSIGNAENFGLIWDVAHSDKTYGGDWPTFYDGIKPWIHHIHIKDHKRLTDGSLQLCMTGEGDIPLADLCRTLTEDGYDGFFSLEWEKKWHPDLQEPEAVFPAYIRYMQGLAI